MRSQAKNKQRQDAVRAAKKADHSSPLRLVVDVVLTEKGFERELLECGHLHRPRNTWHGSESAKRRRCKKCAIEINRI